jgi:hypothetical protein
VVLVGNRQDGREIDKHVTPVPPVAADVVLAVRRQLAHGHYAPSTLYGDGHVSERIAEALVRLTPYIQKRLYYIHDGLEPAKPVHPPAVEHSVMQHIQQADRPVKEAR